VHLRPPVNLAEQRLFEIQNTPDDEIRDYGTGRFGDKYPDYSWDYEIEEEQSEFYTDEAGFIIEPEYYRVITLSVSYKDRGKTFTPVTLVTYDTKKLVYLE
jgi:hypothetical protein